MRRIITVYEFLKPLFIKIVAKLDKEMEALEGVRLLKQEAEKRIPARLRSGG